MRSCLEYFFIGITVLLGIAGFNMFVFGFARGEGVLLLCIAGFTYMLAKSLEKKDDWLTDEDYDTLDEIRRNQRTESSYDKSTHPETPVDSSLSTKRYLKQKIDEILENQDEMRKIVLGETQLIKEAREKEERIQKKMFDQVCKDIDGNVYKTVRIGNKLWMAENLKTTRYNDGTPISHVTHDEVWKGLTTGAYCWYDNKIENRDIYGALYNWFAVNNGKLCPDGWRVPTGNDWTVLTDYLGGEDIAGGKLKEINSWKTINHIPNDLNERARNETGFSALPGGGRWPNGSFFNAGYDGFWWSATEDCDTDSLSRYMYSDFGSVNRGNLNKSNGFSVRCLRNL